MQDRFLTMAWGKYRSRSNKFGVAPKAKRTFKGVVYDSKLEKDHAIKLALLAKAGKITRLSEQVAYSLDVNGVHICDYVADFVYVDEVGREVVCDAKGMLTDVYRLKKKLMKAVHGIDILEVYAKKKKVTKKKTIKTK